MTAKRGSLINPIPGLDAAAGPPGIEGEQGDPGELGPPGLPGVTGAAGAVGAEGSMGPPGIDGLEGETGPPGQIGATGATGLTGSPGIAGDEGEPGEIGPPGLIGTTGAAGPIGATGVAGVMGPPGIDAEDGVDGFPGPTGATGSAGAAGAAGATGATGTMGPPGWDGEEGEPGMMGPPGVAAAGGGGATTALDNLAAVAINADLLPHDDSGHDLGDATHYWAEVYSDKVYLGPNATATLDGATAGQVTLTGNLKVSAHVGVVAAPVITTGIKYAETVAYAGGLIGGYFGPTNTDATDLCAAIGISGIATVSSAGVKVQCYGLNFAAIQAGAGVLSFLYGANAYIATNPGAGLVDLAIGGRFTANTISTTGPITDCRGVHIGNMGKASVVTATGLYISAQTLATANNYGIYQLGPTTTLITSRNVLESFTCIGAVAVPVLSAVLELQSTTGALLVSRLTTAQAAALTAVNGMIIYESTLNLFKVYENGAWRTM